MIMVVVELAACGGRGGGRRRSCRKGWKVHAVPVLKLVLEIIF